VGATPVYGFPYPGIGDAPNGPSQVQALAEAVEVDLQAEAATRAAADTALSTADHAYYYQTGVAQSIATGTDQRVNFNSNRRTSANISTAVVAGGTEFTIAKTGVWRIEAGVAWALGANNTERYLGIVSSNGVPSLGAIRYAEHDTPSNTPVTALPIRQSVGTTRPFVAGDKVAALVFQSDTGAVSLSNAQTDNIHMAFTFVGV
jgi:hypothetical protein